MAQERKIAAVSPQLFTSNGSAQGLIVVADTAGFRTKQSAYLKNNTTTLAVQVKRVISPTMLIVGAVDNKIASWTPLDISAFTLASGASIGAEEQNKNNIPSDDHYSAVYESDPIVADRSILVDKYGQFYDDNNPLPIDAEFSGTLTVNLDGFSPTAPDSVQITGSEDGTKTGTKHSARVDSDLDLRVAISDGVDKATVSGGKLSVTDVDSQTILSSIDAGIPASLGQQNMASSMPVTIASNQTPIPVAATLTDEPIKISGTENGLPGGTEYAFVNNKKNQILASHDRLQNITYADFGTKDQRIIQIDYTSPTFPAVTASKIMSYSLVGTKYRRDSIVWNVI